MQAEELHTVGEDFRSKCMWILSLLGFRTYMPTTTINCVQRQNHSGGGQHTIDGVCMYGASQNTRKFLLIEAKRSVNGYEGLKEEVEKLVEKATCFSLQQTLTRGLGAIREILIITESSFRSDTINRFNNLCGQTYEDTEIYVRCIFGPRFRLIHRMAEYIHNSRGQRNILMISPSLSHSDVLGSGEDLDPSWFSSTRTTYIIVNNSMSMNVGIFNFGMSYTLDDWERDSESAVTLNIGIGTIESMIGIPNDLVRRLRELNVNFSVVDHRQKRSHFKRVWDYTLRDEVTG